jgi:hypothetical protein
MSPRPEATDSPRIVAAVLCQCHPLRPVRIDGASRGDAPNGDQALRLNQTLNITQTLFLRGPWPLAQNAKRPSVQGLVGRCTRWDQGHDRHPGSPSRPQRSDGRPSQLRTFSVQRSRSHSTAVGRSQTPDDRASKKILEITDERRCIDVNAANPPAQATISFSPILPVRPAPANEITEEREDS